MSDTENIVSYPDVSLNGLHTARAIANKWIGYIPLRNALGKNYKNLELDLVRFTIPQVTIGSSSTSFKGISFKFPTKVINEGDRTVTFEYKVSEDWYNYRSLYSWASSVGSLNPVEKSAWDALLLDQTASSVLGTTSAASGEEGIANMLDCRVWLLNNYKQRILDFVFHGCFIENFSDLSLDAGSTEEVIHSFTCAYAYMTMEPVTTNKNIDG